MCDLQTRLDREIGQRERAERAAMGEALSTAKGGKRYGPLRTALASRLSGLVRLCEASSTVSDAQP